MDDLVIARGLRVIKGHRGFIGSIHRENLRLIFNNCVLEDVETIPHRLLRWVVRDAQQDQRLMKAFDGFPYYLAVVTADDLKRARAARECRLLG